MSTLSPLEKFLRKPMVVGRLRQHFCCRALRRTLFDPSYAEHIQREQQWLLS